MMSKLYFIRAVLGIALLIGGLALLVQPQFEQKKAEREEKKLVEAFKQLATTNENSEKAEATKLNSKVKDAKGILIIPKIDLEMLIFEGADANSLNRGVGLLQTNKKLGMDNIGLAGHRGARYGKQLNRLDELVINDEIHVKQGSTQFTFIVEDKYVVDRTRVDVLDELGSPYLTLVTCTPIGAKNPTDRLIVQAKLKSTHKEDV